MILAKVLVKALALVVEDLVGKAQTSAIPTRSIPDKHNLVRYINEKVRRKLGFRGVLINLNQSKAFDKVDHQYLGDILKAASFGFVFRGWIAAIHRGIYSVVNINQHLSEPFQLS